MARERGDRDGKNGRASKDAAGPRRGKTTTSISGGGGGSSLSPVTSFCPVSSRWLPVLIEAETHLKNAAIEPESAVSSRTTHSLATFWSTPGSPAPTAQPTTPAVADAPERRPGLRDGAVSGWATSGAPRR